MSTNQYKGLEIVILCNSKDVFLTKVCVASIRYYYPEIPISLLKDNLQGDFSTRNIEKYFQVGLLDLPIDKFGWGVGKVALLLAEKYRGKKILMLDSDIVFIGPVLDKILPLIDEADFVVSPEYGVESESDWFRRTYYKMEWAKFHYPELVYPGYSFNTGQLVITPGLIPTSSFDRFIDMSSFPFWRPEARDELPCVDQSLLNILLPVHQAKGDLKFAGVYFQLWSEAPETQMQFQLHEIAQTGFPYLIHWAGAKRVADFSQMTRSDVMFFFKQYYFSKLPSGAIRLALDNYWQPWRYRMTQILKRFIK